MNQELTLRIILEEPPAFVDFGLQKGNGRKYETIQKQQYKGKDLVFEFTISVRTDENMSLKFFGKFAQGTPENRFVYIDIGTYAGQTNTSWSRRLKIPLNSITPAMAEKSFNDPDIVIETMVPGTAKDGSPACATVKPFPGWHFSERIRK